MGKELLASPRCQGRGITSCLIDQLGRSKDNHWVRGSILVFS